MIGKLYLWDCRTSQIRPNIYGVKKKIALKYETENILVCIVKTKGSL